MNLQDLDNQVLEVEDRGLERSAAVFSVGMTVGESGTYVCVPCGYRKYLKKGDKFPACISCMKMKKGSGDGERFFKVMEQWELLGNSS